MTMATMTTMTTMALKMRALTKISVTAPKQYIIYTNTPIYQNEPTNIYIPLWFGSPTPTLSWIVFKPEQNKIMSLYHFFI